MSAAEITVWTDSLTESNCYIVHNNKESSCVVIDPNDQQGLLALLAQKALSPEWIFLTHEHCDHMAGLETLRQHFPAACVMVSAACNTGIQNARLNMSLMMEVYLTFAGKSGVHYPPFTCRPADKTYDEQYTMLWCGHTFRFVPLPGHTAGSAGIFLDEHILFSGDYLLPDREVILRLPGGNEKAYREITEPFLLQLPQGLAIYPGHGSPYVLEKKE